MAVRPNPYQTPTAYGNSMGQGMSNIAQAIMTSPNAGTMEAEQAGWNVRKTRDDLYEQQDERTGRRSLGQLISDFTPQESDPRAFYSEAVSRGAMDVGDANALMQGLMGNVPGATTDQRIGSLVGAGSTLSANSAVDESQWQQLQEGDEDPMSRDRLIADIYSREGADAANEARRALYGESEGGSFNMYGGMNPDKFWLMENRRQKAQEQIRPAMERALVNRGAWMSEEGDFMDEALPPGMYELGVDEATQMYMDDVQSGRAPRAMEYYVQQALGDTSFSESRDYGIEPDDWALTRWWKERDDDAERVLQVENPAPFMQGPNSGGDQEQAPAAQLDNAIITGPDGSRVSPADVRETARQEGMSEEQVIRELGLTVVPGG